MHKYTFFNEKKVINCVEILCMCVLKGHILTARRSLHLNIYNTMNRFYFIQNSFKDKPCSNLRSILFCYMKFSLVRTFFMASDFLIWVTIPIMSRRSRDFDLFVLQCNTHTESYYITDCSLTEEDAEIVLKILTRHKDNVPPSHSGQAVLDREENGTAIMTFSQQLDMALDGGVKCGQVTEICGLPGSGKTQLWYML